MKAIVLFNPISGSGRAAMAGQRVVAHLEKAGHEVVLAHTRLEPAELWLDDLLEGANVLVVVGGDGAMRMAAASASRKNVAIYHWPSGTENLFAREFGMDKNPATLLRAMKQFHVRNVDMGTANNRTFLLMASVGYDADVVHDLSGRRGASISHLSYVSPMVAQLRRWKPPILKISIDEEHHNRIEGTGFVVVANSKHYGWRLNPCGKATMNDGLLDIAFFAAKSRLEMIGWAMRCRLQRHLNNRRLTYRTGRQVVITSEQSQRYQLDGDPPGANPLSNNSEGLTVTTNGSLHLAITIQPGTLRVLLP